MLNMKTDYFLNIVDASFKRNGQVIFDNLNWTINHDENWVISGNNGSGKTSLIECIKGKNLLISGELKISFLENLGFEEAFQLKKSKIQLVTFNSINTILNFNSYYYQQRYNATESDEYITVKEFISNPEFKNNPETDDILDMFLLKPLFDLQLIKLSNGQLKKLLLFKAIINFPSLLILDNPYTGLDNSSRKELNILLDYLNRKHNIKLIIVDNQIDLPDCITHELKLNNFKIEYKGKRNQLNRKDNNFDICFSDKIISKINTLLADNKIENYYEKIISFENVSVKYDDTDILKNINWTVKQGEKWSLFGSNGSGKTTMLSLIYGDNPQAYKNKIILFDKLRGSGESIWDIKANIGFTSPELHINFDYSFSTFQVVATGLFDSLFLKRKVSNKENELINLFFQYFEIEHLSDKTFSNISTGEQRIVLFIRSLIKKPVLLLFDEPFQSFDQKNIEKAKYLLEKIITKESTLIFITHFKNEIPSFIKNHFYLEKGQQLK